MKIKDLTISALCATLMVIFSQIALPLPFSPVPVTLQIFGVVFISSVFTKKQAFTGVLVFLLLGAIGIPVFANFSGGFHRLIGPSGGYLIGFLIMTVIIGFAKDKNKVIFVAATYFAMAVDYILGILQLMIVTGTSLSGALVYGLFPFILKDIVVTLCAILISFKLSSILKKQRVLSTYKVR